MDFPSDNKSPHKEQGRLIFGSVVVIVGVLILLHNLFPEFSVYYQLQWPLILIIIGIGIGIKTRFRRNAWWILILIGSIYFLHPYFFPMIPTRLIVWPGILIALGLVMIFRKRRPAPWERQHFQLISNDADTVNIDVSFGARKEIITSKSFKGGSIRVNFAGAEVNLVSADAGVQPMILDIAAAFGGVELIVPSNWEIQNEINPTMGSVEDQRFLRSGEKEVDRKVLVLRGTCSFGSVEIKSY